VTDTGKLDRAAAWSRHAALWLRDTGLGGFGFALVLVVALSGWSASFIGLHLFGEQHMMLSHRSAWLVPMTFDGAPAGLSIVVMRAGVHGRSATLWRTLIVAFTALSSWINWEHISDPVGRDVAALMPPAAVILFEGLMSEVRAAAKRRDGAEVRPRLHPLRFLFDHKGTWNLVRAYVLNLPLPDRFEEVPNQVQARPSEPEPVEVHRPGQVPEPAAPQVPAGSEPLPSAAVEPADPGQPNLTRTQPKRSKPKPAAEAKPTNPGTPSVLDQVQQILDLIQEHGYDTVKLKFVQEQTGMSKTTAYNRLIEARTTWAEEHGEGG
jgi:hypothetical protein